MQVMASSPIGLLSLVVFMVLVVEPHPAYGSSPGDWFGRNQGEATPLVNGICATSVTIHGYKCEEHQVRAHVVFGSNLMINMDFDSVGD